MADIMVAHVDDNILHAACIVDVDMPVVDAIITTMIYLKLEHTHKLDYKRKGEINE